MCVVRILKPKTSHDIRDFFDSRFDVINTDMILTNEVPVQFLVHSSLYDFYYLNSTRRFVVERIRQYTLFNAYGLQFFLS